MAIAGPEPDPAPENSARPRRPALRLAVGLLAAGGLLLEIALTRVLAVAYVHAFTYLVLAVAVLGIGLGAGLAALRSDWRGPRKLALWATCSGLGAALLAVTLPLLATVDARPLTFALTALPYLFIGMALAAIFGSASEQSSKLYLADLGGAGLGAMLAAPLLNFVGGIGALLAAALVLALAAPLLLPKSPITVLAPRTRSEQVVRSLAFFGAAGIGLLLGWHLVTGQPDIDLARLAHPKPASEQLRRGATPVASRWDAFARADLLLRPDGSYLLYLDGAAGSVVPDAGRPDRWQRDVGFLPFVADRPDNVFIIGPGGGLDVALARAAGVAEIHAAELSGAAVELVRALGEHTGGVYDDDVILEIAEGRSTLRRSQAAFDLIFLSQAVTLTTELRSFALAENGLYTIEAFTDYLAHLTPEGQIALKLYDEITLTRALTTAIAALTRRGATTAEAAQHLLAVLDNRANPPVPLLLVRNQPFGFDEAVRVARVAEELELALLLVPGLLAPPALEDLVAGRTDLSDLISASDADISPPTDARPFFFQFERGLPRALRPLLVALALLLALGGAALVATQRRLAGPFPRWAPLLFALLGTGFMLVEISILQRVQLVVGHPVASLSVVLGALLVGGGLGSGLGSGLAGRLNLPPLRAAALAGLLVAVLFAIWSLTWNPLTELLRHAPDSVRLFVTILSLLPVALPLGAPFPLALRAAGRHSEQQVALAWAVNGVTSVAGSVAATALALTVGFPWVAVAGLACYLGVAGAATMSARHR